MAISPSASIQDTLPVVGHTTAELEQLCLRLGEPLFRGRQIAHWVYCRAALQFDEMTDLPEHLRERLAGRYHIGLPHIVRTVAAADGTEKFLLQLADAERVETVYLPYADRVSLCISTQVGCPAGCVFCATGQTGWARNMTAGEIVGQVLMVQRHRPQRRISHVVLMGMGEPLFNYDAVVKALRLMIQEVGISPRRITLSTVGVPENIRKLAREGLPITLALSLHAPDDALRARMIPTGRKWKLREILDACRDYVRVTHRDPTFEYLLLAGVNDHPWQAEALAHLLGDLPGNVNLIPYNPVATQEDFRRPSPQRIAAFREVLERAGRVTTQRKERGSRIAAACGQLRRESGNAGAVGATAAA
ncbi:MAG: 23S rRNA (adenine(2503)-C(2))-methyltransferase RlmN [Chthonomonadales bacterium]